MKRHHRWILNAGIIGVSLIIGFLMGLVTALWVQSVELIPYHDQPVQPGQPESHDPDSDTPIQTFVTRDPEIVSWMIEGREYQLIRADSPQEHATGLMHQRELPHADGMVFVFDRYAYQTFWNQNTYLPLTIYWMRDDQVVGTVQLPPITQTGDPVSVFSPEPVNYVVEVVDHDGI